MRNRKSNSRVCAILLAAALMAAALSGCVQTGEQVPAPTPGDRIVEQTPAVSGPVSDPVEPSDIPPQKSEEPAVGDRPEPTPPANTEPVAEPTPNEPPAPVTTPEPGTTPVPEPTPVTTPEPVVSIPPVPEELVADTTKVEAELEDEAVALSSAPAALPNPVSAVASGVLEKKNANAVIDYSNTADGYVMAQYTAKTDLRLKVQVKGPTTTYTYNLTPQKWAVFPLSDGNGVYQVTVYQNVTGSKYAAVLSMNTQVELKDEFAPFLHSNQYVDYDNAPRH